MQKYKNKSICDLKNLLNKSIHEYIKLKLVYHIKINYKKYLIEKEELLEEGIFVLLSNNINKKIIGIVPTKTDSIYGNNFDEIYIIKDFTDDIKHFIHTHLSIKEEIPEDKPHIYCDKQGGIIVYNFDMTLPFGFYSTIIPKEKRTKENLLDNYYIIYKSFYDCAKYAGDDEYKKLTNEEAVIKFLVETIDEENEEP